jgi:hypothetical protein
LKVDRKLNSAVVEGAARAAARAKIENFMVQESIVVVVKIEETVADVLVCEFCEKPKIVSLD